MSWSADHRVVEGTELAAFVGVGEDGLRARTDGCEPGSLPLLVYID